MLKTAGIVAVGVVVLAGLLLGFTNLPSYVATLWGQASDAAKDMIPVKLELERAERMLSDIDPEIKSDKRVIAKEEVEVKKLGKDIAAQEQRMSQDKTEILTLRGHIDSGSSEIQLAGKTYTPDQVKEDLSRRFERFKVAQSTLESKKKLLAAKERSLDAARKQYDRKHQAKKDLELKIEELQARIRTYEATEDATKIAIDGSTLDRVQETLDSVENRIEVEEIVIESEAKEIGDEIPLEGDVPEDLSKQIDEFFKEGEGEEKPAGKSA